MTIETLVRCNRCHKLINPDDCTLSLTVHPSEDGLLNASENRIDLCFACEKDMVAFMSGEVFHKFLEGKT